MEVKTASDGGTESLWYEAGVQGYLMCPLPGNIRISGLTTTKLCYSLRFEARCGRKPALVKVPSVCRCHASMQLPSSLLCGS